MKTTLILLATAALTHLAGAQQQQAAQQRALPVQQPAAPAAVVVAPARQAQRVNPQIDYNGHVALAEKIAPIREKRRLSEEQFMALAAERGTIVLDARSADKYAMRHIKGAINLPFTDFTAEALAKVIPAPDTRILIYCNNNLRGDVTAAPEKRAMVALNISTYVNLAAYGYTNIYELGPTLDVRTAKVPFEGSGVAK